MRKNSLLFLGLTFLASFGLAGGLGAEVKMNSISYSPKQIEIVVGETVTWKNVAYTEHSATSEDKSLAFDTGLVAPGKEAKVTFKKAGTFPYHCSIHGKTMSGVVVVKEATK